MDGFYAAYLTGRGGNTVLLFAIKSGQLIGVDGGGMKYSGTVQAGQNGQIGFHIDYTITPGTQLITGVGTVPNPTPVALDFTAPPNFAEGAIIGVQTPFGPVNAKITKLRDFDL